MKQEPENHDLHSGSGNEEPVKKETVEPNPPSAITKSCRLSRLIFLGQLPLLTVPKEKEYTGGTVYSGESLFGEMMPPLWLVTSYRSAGN